MSKKRELIDYITKPIGRLVARGSAIGVVLFLSALAAIIVANSSWGGDWYHHFWEKEILLSFENWEFSLNLHHFINDGLRAIFFFLVGLEIKREVIAGDLREWRKASLPVAGAIGGMLVPALIYFIINPSGPTADGWGIPMATDIAFVLGLLGLVARRIATSTKVFITSLAVVDDIGAVLVIAFFYTSNFDANQLLVAAVVWGILMIANKIGVRNTLFYTFLGIGGIWFAFFYSGIHPSIAGILLAFTIPSRYRINRSEFTEALDNLFTEYRATPSINLDFNTNYEDKLLNKIGHVGDNARTPLQKIEHGLHNFVYFIIMPVFAFANAGVVISDNFFSVLLSPVSLGIMGGLIVGKIVGISLMARLMVGLGISKLPTGSNWNQIYGTSILAGIGFTMSLFISELAFSDPAYKDAAKAAILTASVIATIGGLAFIRFTNKEIDTEELT